MKEAIIGVIVVLTISISLVLLRTSSKKNEKDIERPEFIRLTIGGRGYHGKNR